NNELGFVFQSFNLLPRTSALDNVALPLSYGQANLTQAESRRRAEEMLGLVGLQDRMNHEPSQLSGGQQQRVAIARAWVNRPQVILADEPTGNLDSKTSEDILSLFQKLNQEGGITIILVTHDPMVARHGRRTIHIHDGLVVEGAYAAEGDPARREPAPEATL
ncbi:MAG: ATP-binding cassette domain-containing protein, partial [Pseudomonadota bacterium]